MAAGGGRDGQDSAGELSDALRERIEEELGKKRADLNNVIIGDAGAVLVAQKLRGNTIVETLSLQSCGIGVVGVRALAESLGDHNATLKVLWLGANTSMGDAGAGLIGEMLKKNTTLEMMGLHSCGFGPRGARALGEALVENISLKAIGLKGNKIGDEGAEALAQALRCNESLEELWYLSDCQMTDVGAAALISALRENNSTLTTLDLDWSKIWTNRSVLSPSIKASLEENKAVRAETAERRARCLLFCCLKLAPSAHEHVVPSIGAVPVPVMQYAVEHAGELHVAKRFEVGALRERIEAEMGKKKADLNHLNIGDAGAVFVAQKLRGNTIVETLSLQYCGIGVVGVRALAESLGDHNATLKVLWLGANASMSDAGAGLIGEMLKKNTTLERLGLLSCGIGPRGARALGEALVENNSLKMIGLSDSKIGDEGANGLVQALRLNESLEELFLYNCKVADAGAAALISALRESNSTLTTLDLDWSKISWKNRSVLSPSIKASLEENKAVRAETAEQRARCLLFCCLKLAPSAHEHVVPSIGAVPVPDMQYAVEHAGELHVAKRFEVGNAVAGQSSTGVHARSASSAAHSLDFQPATSRRR